MHECALGAAEATSNALLNLFLAEAEPQNPVEFIRENMDFNINKEMSKLRADIESAKERLAKLNARIDEMRKLGFQLIEKEIEEAEENMESVEGDAGSQVVDGDTGSQLVESDEIEKNSDVIKEDSESMKEDTKSEAIDEEVGDGDSKTNEKVEKLSESEITNK